MSFIKMAPMSFTRQVRSKFDLIDFLVLPHAIAGMWHRRIDPSFVAETCLAPDQKEHDQEDEQVEILFKKFNSKTLRVVVSYSEHKKSIISVTWRGWSVSRVGKSPMYRHERKACSSS